MIAKANENYPHPLEVVKKRQFSGCIRRIETSLHSYGHIVTGIVLTEQKFAPAEDRLFNTYILQEVYDDGDFMHVTILTCKERIKEVQAMLEDHNADCINTLPI